MNIYRLLLYCALLISFITNLFGGEEDRTSSIIKDHVRPIFTNGFDNRGLFLLGTGAFAGLLAHSYDKKVNGWFKQHRLISKDLEKLGYEVGADGRMLIGSLIHIIFNRSNGISHFKAYLTTGLTVEMLKLSFHRMRPNGNGYKSLPSGHVAVVVTSATSLSYSYGWKAAIPTYTVAALTFISRLQSNGHWLSDNIIGATIGFFWGRATFIPHGNLYPYITKDIQSISYHFEF